MKKNEALAIASRTDPGRVRPHNEDAVFASAASGLVVLADGMGGYNAGEVASGMAVAWLAEKLPARLTDALPEQILPLIEQEIAAANSAIHQAANSQPQYAGMGTTLVLGHFDNNRLTLAHIGDSRAYRLRGDDFVPLTRDHSLLQEQIDSGVISAEEARFSQNKNLVTRALGVDATVEIESHVHEVIADDVYLFCSDGLNDMVDEEEIALTLQTLHGNLPLAAEQLVLMANDNGGRDNVSVILVKISGDFAAPDGWWQKLLAWFKA